MNSGLTDIKTKPCPYCGYGIGEWVFASHVTDCPKNPWAYITTDVGTLPPKDKLRVFAVLDPVGEHSILGQYDGRSYRSFNGTIITDLVYAHTEPWPKPPPYPGPDTNTISQGRRP